MPYLQYSAAFRGDQPAAAQDCDLADRRELALVAVERTRMPMVITDPRQPDNPIVLANQAFLNLTGYTSDEVIGQNCRFLQGPDTAPSDIAKLHDALARCEEFIEIELLNYRKDGSTFLNALDIHAVHNDEGELLYYFASQKDVTAQRKAQELEANEHRLLMEVDHRALNALELVQSIVSLSHAEDVEGLSRSINRRVASLASAHRLLAERQWQPINLAELINAQLSSRIGDRVTLEGETTQLLAHVVQPLGLVLHELISNAQIHGGLSQIGGRVRLTWHVENSTLFLHWQEIAPAPKRQTLNEGFGLQIVRTVVERQLGGQTTIDLHDSVLDATIVVPEAMSLAPQENLNV